MQSHVSFARIANSIAEAACKPLKISTLQCLNFTLHPNLHSKTFWASGDKEPNASHGGSALAALPRIPCLGPWQVLVVANDDSHVNVGSYMARFVL